MPDSFEGKSAEKNVLPGRFIFPTAGWVSLLLFGCLVFAQEDESPVAPLPTETVESESTPPQNGQTPTVPARIDSLLPNEYWLPDDDGRLRAILGFPYEEFVELYRQKENLTGRTQPPRFSLQRVSIVGRAEARVAALTVVIDIVVNSDEWVRVPLRFDRAMLREPVVYKGPGEQFTHFEGPDKGYVSWIRGDGEQPRQLTLKLAVPVTSTGRKHGLKMAVPRAAVSELKLTVPLADVVAEATDGVTLSPPVAGGEGTTELTALGPGGDFSLSWYQQADQSTEIPTVLEAVGTIFARLDGAGVQTETMLTVRSIAGSFDRFQVRLPKGAEWVSRETPDYEVVTAEDQVVEIRRSEKNSKPLEVHLVTRRTHDPSKPEEWLELAGFEVLGAARQSGHLAVAATRDWQVIWRPNFGIRQVDQLPEALQHEEVVAGFQYLSQPCSLAARAVVRKTRSSVEPEYLLLVDADRVRLRATLNYTVRGTETSVLDVVVPPGWEFDAAGPANLVAVDGVAMIDSDLLSIPLLQPTGGQIQLKIDAHWPIPEGAQSLVIPLPQPQVDVPGPATVIVLPADDVELVPKDELMPGFVRGRLELPEDMPSRQQEPLTYRAESAKPVFAADYRIHSQQIEVKVLSRIRLQPTGANAEQTLTYTIRYKPTDHLLVDVPSALAGLQGLEFLHDDQRLPQTNVSGATAETNSSGSTQKRIDLGEAHIGRHTLRVRYPIALAKLKAESFTDLAIPLVMPADGDLTDNRVEVIASPSIELETRGGPWTVAPADSLDRNSGIALGLLAKQRTEQVKLAARLGDNNLSGTTVVKRAWIQTWLTASRSTSGGTRQDRAVFLFTSTQKQLRLSLPGGVAVDEIEILLDRERVTGRPTGDGQLLINLPADANHRDHVLEVSLHAAERPARGQMTLEVPSLGPDVWVRRLYWQLVLPSNEHVFVSPEGFTSEYTWDFNGYAWGRKPLLGESELADWVTGYNEAGNSVHPGANQYLFSSLGPVEKCELRTADRTWIVLCASGAALVLGLLLIYVPMSRHPATLLATAMILLCVGMLYPEPTLLVAQAASLGLALTLIAGLLQRSVARRRRGTIMTEASSSIMDTGSTQTQYPPPLSGGPISTQSTTIPPPDAEP